MAKKAEAARPKVAMTWEQWPLDRIKPYPKNARTHPPEQIKLLAQLLAKHGADQPIVVDEKGMILKGHGRLLAATQAKMPAFPVVVRSGLSAAEKTAIRIQDNQIGLLSGWDEALLRLEVDALKAIDFDLSSLGFPDGELNVMLDGWNTGTRVEARDGEHLDGIRETIAIIVDQEIAPVVKAAIEATLKQKGLAFEFR